MLGGIYDQSIPGDDLQSEQASYGPKKLYARTKREELVITEQWAERLRCSESGAQRTYRPTGWREM